MKTYFTADLHLGCDRLRKHTRSEFDTIEEHDEELLDALNRTVSRNDQLVIVGDFCLRKPGRYRPKIKCRNIFFICGNHDKEPQIRAAFGGNVWQSKMVKGVIRPRQNFWCCHYPPAFWPSSHFGSVALYGHIHDHLEYEAAMDVGMPGRRSLDIGVDAARRIFGAWRPFSEAEVLDLLKDQKGHEELWREIPGYEGIYEVSTLGNVRSVDREIKHRAGLQRRQGQWMRLSTDTWGYKVVTLSANGIRKTHKVPRLVLLAFMGPSEQQALHGLGGKANNSLPNLSYGTGKENWGDRYRDGTHLCRPVRRSDGKEYSSLTEASKDNGVLVGSISNVCYGKSNATGGFGWQFI